MRIDLHRLRALVSEQLLDIPQIGPLLEEMCGKAVSQRMGTESL